MFLLRRKLVLVAAAALAGAACGPRLFQVPLKSCPVKSVPGAASAKVVVQYLGVGGFLFKRGSDVILAAPFYSSPSLLEIAFNHEVRPDRDVIDRLFPLDGENATAILVGHSHYDHLMDVPYIALHRAKRADIYGSRTTARLLAPIARALRDKSPPTRIVALDQAAGDEKTPGVWQTIGSGVRVMALRNEHAPVFTFRLNIPFQKAIDIPFHLWRGAALDEDAKELPRTVSQWVQGPVFAFVIDFLDAAGKPAYRIYYQDSGTAMGNRVLPEAVLAERGIDLAILCLDGDIAAMEGRPEADILRGIKPKAVIVAHWENFLLTQDFARTTGGFHAIPSSSLFQPVDIKRVLTRMSARFKPVKTPYYVPCPTRSILEFAIE